MTDGKRAKIKHIIIQWRVGENGDGGKGGKILTSRKCGKSHVSQAITAFGLPSSVG